MRRGRDSGPCSADRLPLAVVWTAHLILHSKVRRYRPCYIAVPLNSASLNVKTRVDWKATVSTLSTFRSVDLHVTRESCGGCCRQRILDLENGVPWCRHLVLVTTTSHFPTLIYRAPTLLVKYYFPSTLFLYTILSSELLSKAQLLHIILCDLTFWWSSLRLSSSGF